MSITFADVATIRDSLAKRGAASTRGDEELLRHTESLLGSPGTASLRAQIAAQVGTHLHQTASPEARNIARGALDTIVDTTEDDEDAGSGELKHLFVLRFALHHLRQLTDQKSAVLDFGIDDDTKAVALSMFDTLMQEALPPDRDLLATAELYAEEFSALSSSSLFAHFLSDLAFLQDVVRAGTESTDDTLLARAALAYLLKEKDAIPDDLGLVGVLDDAFIARTAAERIDPTRTTTSELIEATVSKWPFLLELFLHGESGYWTPSEFALVNLAIAMDSSRNAIVVPDPGPLPFLLAAIETLIFLDRGTETDVFRPKKGDWIRPAGDEPAAQFIGYFVSSNPAIETEQPAEAKFFKLAATRGTKHRQQGHRYVPIHNLNLWEHSTETRVPLRPSLVPGADITSAGALERLFQRLGNSKTPLHLSAW